MSSVWRLLLLVTVQYQGKTQVWDRLQPGKFNTTVRSFRDYTCYTKCLKYLRFRLHLHLSAISWMPIQLILEKIQSYNFTFRSVFANPANGNSVANILKFVFWESDFWTLMGCGQKKTLEWIIIIIVIHCHYHHHHQNYHHHCHHHHHHHHHCHSLPSSSSSCLWWCACSIPRDEKTAL